MINPDALRRARMRNHIVVVGCGRLAMLYLGRLQETKSSRTPLLVVEINPNKLELVQARAQYGASILVGDIRSDALLKSLHLDRAKRVLILTGDDLANLDVACRVAQIAPQLSTQLVVHVADMRMLEHIREAGLLAGATTFNSHAVAATHLVQTRIQEHFQQTEPRDTVVLAGFGRFGQTILATLQQSCAGTFKHVIIADVEAEGREMTFEERVGFMDNYARTVFDADLRDPRCWRQIDEALRDVERPVVVLGSGDDSVNLRAALRLSTQRPEALIIARCFRLSAFSNHVSAHQTFEIVAMNNLLLKSMPPAWFD